MIAFLLAAAVTCMPPASQDLVGSWETRDTSMGGIGGAIELGADGRATSITTVIVGFTYELEGDLLRIRWENAPPEKIPDAVPTHFEDDQFIQTGTDGTQLRRTRVGSATPGAPPIVGIWSYTHYTGSRAFERYDADGSMQLRIPMRGSRGCYSVEKDRLALELAGQKKRSYRFVVEGQELRLTATGKKEPEVLLRSRGGAWYLNDAAVPGLE